MTKSRTLPWAACLLALTLMTHSAAAAVVTVYEDSLTGDGDYLHGTTVDSSTGLHGGTLDATWISRINDKPERAIETEDGALMGGYTSAFLPLEIQEGVVYKLTATIHKLGGNTKWGAVGFARTAGGEERPFVEDLSYKSSAAVRVYSTHPNSGAPEFFAGPGATNPIAADDWTDALRGEQTVSIILDTTESQWKVHAIVGGIASSVHTYSEADSIAANFKYVGFGSDNDTNAADGALVSNFSLVVVPEPGTAALMLLGGTMVLLRRRIA